MVRCQTQDVIDAIRFSLTLFLYFPTLLDIFHNEPVNKWVNTSKLPVSSQAKTLPLTLWLVITIAVLLIIIIVIAIIIPAYFAVYSVIVSADHFCPRPLPANCFLVKRGKSHINFCVK